jgi:cytochrome P450 monooxygenase
VSFSRVVKEPIQLSGGFVLEPGQQICVASRQINEESPDLENPGDYEPFRWANDEGPTSSWAHSSTHNLHFGLGRYACPGRFFASYMIKSIMSRLLLEYDFKFEDGRISRPQNLVQGDKILPDYNRSLFFRRRST